jgi:hypothetical protein
VLQRAPVLALLSPPDVFHDHVSDFLHAVLLLRKILSEGGSGDIGQMLMLRDCENLCLGQAALGNTIVQCDHDLAPQRSQPEAQRVRHRG